MLCKIRILDSHRVNITTNFVYGQTEFSKMEAPPKNHKEGVKGLRGCKGGIKGGEKGKIWLKGD